MRGTGRTAKPGEPKQKTSCKNSLSLPRFLLRKVHLGGLERLGLNLTLSFIFRCGPEPSPAPPVRAPEGVGPPAS